jgi:WD40 repeat protein
LLGLAQSAPAAARVASRPAPPITGRVAITAGAQSRDFTAQGDALLERAPDGTETPHRFDAMEKVTCVAASKDGTRLVIGGGVAGRAGSVVVREPDGRFVEVKREKPLFNDLVNAVCWSDDNTTILAGSADKSALALDAKSLDVKAELKGHTGSVLAVASRGELAVTGSYDRTVRVWNLRTGEMLRNLTQHSAPVNALAFEPEGVRFLSGSDDRTVRLWDANNGRLLRIVRDHDGPVLSLAWRPEGAFSGATDGWVRRLDLENGEAKAKLASPDPKEHPSYWIYCLQPGADGTVGAGTDDGWKIFRYKR